MKKLLWIIIVVAIVAGAFYLIKPYLRQEPVNQEELVSPLANYFLERVVAVGLENTGAMPIEGYDADLLIGAFPGILPADFRGVTTYEGYYEVSGDSINFVRSADASSISTAERTVSPKGYETLLHNLAIRLDLDENATSTVDLILEKVSLTDNLVGKLNEGFTVSGLRVMLTQVVEDSRCPKDVQCIQAGTVRVRGTLGDGSRTVSYTFELNKPVTFGDKKITLINVEPETRAGEKIENKDYLFHFKGEKVGQ